MQTAQMKSHKYNQWADGIRQQILSGELKPGERLPSLRQIQSTGISQATLDRALAILEREGLITRRAKSGVFVTDSVASVLEKLDKSPAGASQQTAPHAASVVGIPGFEFALRNHFCFDALLMEGMLKTLRRNNKQIQLLDADSPIGWDRVDGVIMLNDERTVNKYLKPGTYWVSCLGTIEGIPSFAADDSSGMKSLMRHLLELGHTRIACLMESPAPLTRLRKIDAVSERINAWKSSLLEAGVTPEPSWRRTMYVPYELTDDYRRAGHYFVTRWLQSDWKEQGFTALVTQNDIAAMGAIDAFQEAGMRVPEDVSVTGFDGVEPSSLGQPEVTTVRIPLSKIGSDAAETLVKLLDGEQVETGIRFYPLELMVRGSTTHTL